MTDFLIKYCGSLQIVKKEDLVLGNIIIVNLIKPFFDTKSDNQMAVTWLIESSNWHNVRVKSCHR